MCETSSSTQFVDSLNKIWCYYEAFLGQTQMLNAAPVRELANNFLGLTVRERERVAMSALPYSVCVLCVCVRHYMSRCWSTGESSSRQQRNSVSVDTPQN